MSALIVVRLKGGGYQEIIREVDFNPETHEFLGTDPDYWFQQARSYAKDSLGRIVFLDGSEESKLDSDLQKERSEYSQEMRSLAETIRRDVEKWEKWKNRKIANKVARELAKKKELAKRIKENSEVRILRKVRRELGSGYVELLKPPHPCPIIKTLKREVDYPIFESDHKVTPAFHQRKPAVWEKNYRVEPGAI